MQKRADRRGSKPASDLPSGVATGRLVDGRPGPDLGRLNALIGRWITEGQTVATSDAPSVPIVASDVYQWVPGGHFVLHPAYGRIGDAGVGGVEIIGYDRSTGQFRTWFFDSQGNVSGGELVVQGASWQWLGERVR